MWQNFGPKWVLLLVGILGPTCVLGLSCAGSSRSKREGGPTSSTSDDPGGFSPRMVTKLISAGQEPKSALRFKVAKGDKQYVALTTGMERNTSFDGGVRLPQHELLGQKLTLLATVTDVAASGDISFEVSIAKAKVIPHMERMVKSLTGLSANFVMSSRGMLKSYSTNVNEGLDPIMKQAIQGMEDNLPSIAIPFPEAPIGVGAKWSVMRPVESQGVNMTYVAVYELTKFENGTGTVTTEVERTTQPFHVPKKEGRAGNRFNRMTTTTTGTHDFSLEKILPETESLASMTETTW